MTAFIQFLIFALPTIANNKGESNGAKDLPTMKIATLNIIASNIQSPDVQEKHDIQFPNYLKDLRDKKPDKKWSMPHPCKFTFTKEPHNAEYTLEMGETLEMMISGHSHPPHIHVNHMQIMSYWDGGFRPDKWFWGLVAEFDKGRTQLWYQPGEWYDNFATQRFVKLPAVDYSGPYIFHCHWLQHEDLGCMGTIQVNGDTPAGTQTYFPADPSVRDHFSTPNIDYSQAGIAFQNPPQVSWKDFSDNAVDTTLYLDTVDYNGPTTQYRTRGYNGNIPGPTLRLKRGTNVTVELHNLLGANTYPRELNKIGVPNTTNLHTHGLHISPYQPGDDNLHTKVDPGMAVRYQYEIPEDHLGGTHWYHPHYHGSTSLQTAGGAMGMIIVEDEASDNIPQWIQDAEEIQLVMTNMPQTLDSVSWLEEKARGDLPHPTASEEFLLLNGLYQPQITMEQNKWYRWRTVTGTMNYFVWVELQHKGCEFWLLATDGVYIPDGLREIEYLAGSSGNRADIMVRCKDVGTQDLNTAQTPDYPGWYTVWWVWITIIFVLMICCCQCACLFYGCKFCYKKVTGRGEKVYDKEWSASGDEIEFVMSSGGSSDRL